MNKKLIATLIVSGTIFASAIGTKVVSGIGYDNAWDEVKSNCQNMLMREFINEETATKETVARASQVAKRLTGDDKKLIEELFENYCSTGDVLLFIQRVSNILLYRLLKNADISQEQYIEMRSKVDNFVIDDVPEELIVKLNKCAEKRVVGDVAHVVALISSVIILGLFFGVKTFDEES